MSRRAPITSLLLLPVSGEQTQALIDNLFRLHSVRDIERFQA